MEHNAFAPTQPGDLADETEGGLDMNAGNLTGVHWDSVRSCDFDGDGSTDTFMTTGVSWWYRTGLDPRWVFLAQSPKRLADVALGDRNGDGLCDVTVNDGGRVYFTPVPNALQQRISGPSAPDEKGTLVGDAAGNLLAHGFQTVEIPAFDQNLCHVGVPEGTVMAQNPPPGIIDRDRQGPITITYLNGTGLCQS
jgi:hypothetical protein